MVEIKELDDDLFFKQKCDLKIILVGDSAVGKSNEEITNSTHALIIYKYKYNLEGKEYLIDIWDTAGQTSFNSLHSSYYFGAHAALFVTYNLLTQVFDATRKVTYKNTFTWYNEFRSYCPSTPCILVGNKIDMDKKAIERKYVLAEKMNCPFYLTSAAIGTNVVRIFKELIIMAIQYKENPDKDYYDKILEYLEDDYLFDDK